MKEFYSNKLNLKRNWIASFVLTFLFSILGFSQSPVTDNTAGGPRNFTVPANVTHINVAVWGAGGGGGGSNSNGNGGNGGGGGGAASSLQIGVTNGNIFTYNVGTGGTAGAALTGGTGGDGGNTTITSVSPLTSMTGIGGKGGRGNALPLNTPTNSAGGTASGGTTANNTGNNGTQGGGTGGNGGDSGTAFTIFGTGGSGQSNNAGSAGGSPGAGGGGGERNNASGGTNYPGGAGANGRVYIDFISVSGVSPNPVCIGSTITITGNHFTSSGTTTVSINGTPCTSVTVVNSTTITAVVSSGTTSGVVNIINNNKRNNGQTITVNTQPVAPVITSNSPQCNPPGVTISQTGSAPAGETWYWQGTTANGTDTTNSASTYTATTSGTYYIRSRNNTTGCWSADTSIAVVVNNTISTLATSPSPANSATGVCYAGSGAVTSLSWTAAAGATGYDVYFGTAAIPPLVSSNQAGTNYSTGALAASTTYYWRIVPRNTCGATTGLTTTWSFTTGSAICYCTPTTSSNTRYINSVESIGTLNDVTSASAPGYSTSGYGNYTSTTIAEQVPNGPINIKSQMVGAQVIRAYVDWTNDGDFDDTDELVFTTNNFTLTGDTTFGFVVPNGQTPGNYRFRIKTSDTSASFTSCSTSTNGETEDYTISIIADCPVTITSVTDGSSCGPTNTVTLTAVGSAGTTGYYWYTTKTGGTGTFSATSNWVTPSIPVGTTKYYVVAYNGSCESKFRTEVRATVKPVATLSFSNSNPTVCGQDDIITLSATGSNEEVTLLTEKFESGLGSFTSSITGTPGGTNAQWSVQPSTFLPTSTVLWKPAVNSGIIGNQFAFTASDYSTSNFTTDLTTTNSINTTGYTSLFITFRQYYSYFSGDSGRIEVSTDNGATWITAAPAYLNAADQGSASSFADVGPVDLSAYINVTNLKFRFRYTAQFDDGWAIDDIRFYGNRPLAPNFTWTSAQPVDAYTDISCTPAFAYTAGTTITGSIYVKPTLLQLESEVFAFTANANLANGCTTSGTVTVTNKSKVWTGDLNNDWNVEDNWLPTGTGVPDLTNCVIIPNGKLSEITNAPSGYAKSVDVQAGGTLEVTSNNNLIVNDWVKSNGTFNVRNSANLVQLNDSPLPANSGSINMDRTAINLHQFDYIYWSSPVENFAITSVSPLTSTSKIYNWVPDYINGSLPQPAFGWGNWFNVNENMIAGKGYIIRVPNANATFSTTFTGKPNNGVITKSVTRGPYTGGDYAGTNSTITSLDDNWNLVGNPYPSAIDAVEFLAANSGTIAGEVNLWTHGSAILPSSNPSPYYQTFAYNYNSNDYVTYNSSGTNIGPTGGFNGKIAAGQSFFVKMLDGAAGSANITFNNAMRTDGSNNAYNNSQFYRSANGETGKEPERNRIWLDLIDSKLNTSRTMVGYIEGATNDKDHMYDATTNYSESLKSFTTIPNRDEIFVIQGKGLPFTPSDEINFGFQVPANGTYKIAITDVDGLFKDTAQKIYLKDVLTNNIHDLTISPYTFTSNKGVFKNRFLIKFEDKVLSNNDNEFSNSLVVYGKDQLNVISELFNIKSIVVYDLLGKTLLNVKDVNSKEYISVNLKNTNSALLVKTTLENGAVVTKKVIY